MVLTFCTEDKEISGKPSLKQFRSLTNKEKEASYTRKEREAKSSESSVLCCTDEIDWKFSVPH